MPLITTPHSLQSFCVFFLWSISQGSQNTFNQNTCWLSSHQHPNILQQVGRTQSITPCCHYVCSKCLWSLLHIRSKASVFFSYIPPDRTCRTPSMRTKSKVALVERKSNCVVLHDIAWYFMVMSCIETIEVILSDWRNMNNWKSEKVASLYAQQLLHRV